MAELKTQITHQNPKDFLHSITPEQKQADSLALLQMFEEVTGEKAVMWGTSIVGFGKYHYKSEKSRQEGDWFLVGFSPRKQNFSLYIMHGNNDSTALLEKLGKYKRSGGIGGCLYINTLSDVDETVLKKLVETSYLFMKDKTETL